MRSMAPAFVRTLAHWRALRRFRALPGEFHNLVFYSESSADWPHLGPVIERLLSAHGVAVSVLTSDPRDPALALRHARYRAFEIGDGTVRTILFRTIACRYFVMTLPDLGSFHLKRSVHDVRYIYLFHSINSTHTAYRKGAFDAYDTILCVGPHHVREIRATEAAYGLKAKELIEHGSVQLDTVMLQCAAAAPPRSADAPLEVLLAPSWGPCSFIEQPVGEAILETLVAAGLPTVLRLHPMTVRRFPDLVDRLRRTYRDAAGFGVEEDMNALDSWRRAGVMVTDWSGAGIEFAFGLQKPVVYIDTPQKLSNPEWQRIGMRACEDEMRSEIGHVVPLAEVSSLPKVIAAAHAGSSALAATLAASRAKWIFNPGRSAAVAAEYLAGRVA